MKDNKEIEIIKKWGYKLIDDIPKTKTPIKELIYFVHDSRIKHDSGYPLIRVFGITKENKALDLGYHDHIMLRCEVNIDSLGKNIFRMFNTFFETKTYIRGNNIWCSSLFIEEDGEIK